MKGHSPSPAGRDECYSFFPAGEGEWALYPRPRPRMLHWSKPQCSAQTCGSGFWLFVCHGMALVLQVFEGSDRIPRVFA
ncbi:hypothetical protein BJX66DRAFT_171595 [Aspergillus keveii]|uniref:Uncharacterized protein n=1 Tax=Aspergillus keveii TaxID=714993 RepID=A0ABR4G9L9_9EURO